MYSSRDGRRSGSSRYGKRDNVRRRRPYMTRTKDLYKEIKKIGEGTYGEVYYGIRKTTGEMVALKKVRQHKRAEGIPSSAIRELKIYNILSAESSYHRNIVRLYEVVADTKDAMLNMDTTFSMVFEYVSDDLTGIMDLMKNGDIHPFTLNHVRTLMEQLLSALAFLHKRNIVHRDIKCSNLLISRRGILKLADFGLALQIDPKNKRQKLHCKVITLWYRPPELFLGTPKYHSEVDMWSAGCILAEMLCCRPLFAKKTDDEMLPRIFQVCGTPNEDTWPEHTKLPKWKTGLIRKPRVETIQMEIFKLAELLKHNPKFLENPHTHPRMMLSRAFQMVRDLLRLNPRDRISAEDALSYQFMQRCVHPVHLPPIIPDSIASNSEFGFHEMQTKSIRKRSRKKHLDAKKEKEASLKKTKLEPHRSMFQ